MNAAFKAASVTCLMSVVVPAFADDVKLPAPVLQWSFYIFLIFAIVVAVGIFFVRTKKEVTDEPLGVMIDEAEGGIHSVSPYTTVADCVRQMIEHRIGAMLVMDDGKLVGIFTERDCMTRVVGAGLDAETSRVGEVMTRDPYCVSPVTSLEEAMNIISTQRFRHLPVVEDGRVLGMISSGDLTQRLVANRPAEVRELVDMAARKNASR
jgi:signal-transduction protein with cAMP-binding, CBS, and nucleotidyltransferase domain